MDRKEYDANLGLQEGRRKNPGQYKLPPQTYMSLGDIVLVMGAIVMAAALIAHAPEVKEGLWNLLKSALAVVTSVGR
jgi:hypothetical protein